MRRHRLVLAVTAVAVFVAGWFAAQIPAPTVTAQAGQPAASDAETGIRKNADAYTKAFNAGDAKAAATSWTADGEYTDTDGETHRGRDAIEKELAAFLKANPKAVIAITIDSVRPVGRQLAFVEGTARTRTPAEPEPAVSRFRGTFVREDEGWKIASLQDWVSDPATDVTVTDIGWLAGDWAAKGDAGELRLSYTWDENKTFLTGKYILTKDGKPASTGTHIIGTNPEGGLRSWVFDGSGTTGDSVWSRDGTRWTIEATGTLPDGTEITAVNILIPLGNDGFTWQSTQRTAAGVELADQPPVKVTRAAK